jgi:hypothetical protein
MSKGKRLAAGSMGYGRTFYPDDPEDLAYLKQLAKDTRGDENRWPELNLRIHGRPALRDGEPCSHPGCLKHLTHPCEGCGRVGGRSVRLPEYDPETGEELEEGCFMMGGNTPDGLCDPITGCPGCAQERRRRAREK